MDLSRLFASPFIPARAGQVAPHPLEQLEKLEQLRVLGQGRGIQVGIVAEASIGVDTYEDYERFVRLHRQHAPRRAA